MVDVGWVDAFVTAWAVLAERPDVGHVSKVPRSERRVVLEQILRAAIELAAASRPGEQIHPRFLLDGATARLF